MLELITRLYQLLTKATDKWTLDTRMEMLVDGEMQLLLKNLGTHSLTHLLTNLLTYLLTHSLTFSLTYLLTHSYSLLLTRRCFFYFHVC